MDTEFVSMAALLAEPTRALMLLKLISGRSLPAGELAMDANVSPQTASEHLAKLIEKGIVRAERQGRHRYYRLAGEEVADALESLLVLSRGSSTQSAASAAPVVGTLAHARTCYSHLAGHLGVQLADALQREGYLVACEPKAFAITEAGYQWLQDLGLPAYAKSTGGKAMARQCLDWTERRPHISGALGRGLYRRFLELEWIASIPRTRAVRVTLEGRKQFLRRLHVAVG